MDNTRIAALVYCFMGCDGGHNGQLVEWDTNNVNPCSITTLPPITHISALAYLRNHRLFAIAVQGKAVLEAQRIGDVRRETHISLINAVTKKEVRQFPIGLTSIFDDIRLTPYRTHHLIVTRRWPPSVTLFDIRNGSATASLQLPEPLDSISNTIVCPDNSLYINYTQNFPRHFPYFHMKYGAPAIPDEHECTEECAEMVETKETKKSIFCSALCT